MNSSDIIAIIVVITSTLISITSTLVTYFINKNNIQAKRSEIALEKRLEAFREIVECIGNIKVLLYKADKTKMEEVKSNLEKALEEYYVSYRRDLVLLPPTISANVDRYGDRVDIFLHKEDNLYENLVRCREATRKIEREIIDDMQKFVGYV